MQSCWLWQGIRRRKPPHPQSQRTIHSLPLFPLAPQTEIVHQKPWGARELLNRIVVPGKQSEMRKMEKCEYPIHSPHSNRACPIVLNRIAIVPNMPSTMVLNRMSRHYPQ